MAQLAGGILAGGKSSRMGRPKERILLPDGKSMLERVADILLPLVQKLVVVGASGGFDPSVLGATRLDDLRPGLGPLAGLETLLASGGAEGYLVVACDQVRLTTGLLERLLPAGGSPAALRTEKGVELLPFPVYLPAGFLPIVRAALDQGERSSRLLLAGSRIEWRVVAAEAEELVRSINTPEDLRDFIRRD
ncbi:MAG: molybdenum cofactor guanylyltransferase [bacterium]